MRPLIPALIGLAALPAAAQERPTLGWLDFLTPDRIAHAFLQGGIMGLRTQVDLTYADMSVNLLTGRATLTDVSIWPLPDWDADADCVITIDHLSLRTTPATQIDSFRADLRASGAQANAACLPPDARPMLAAFVAGDTIPLDRLAIELDYDVPSAGADIALHAALPGVASIGLTAELDYAWFDAREDPEEPDPVIFLSQARLTLENAGGWAAAQPMLPPGLGVPGSGGQVVEGFLGAALAGMNRDAAGPDAGGDPSALAPSQQAFVTSAATAWEAFLASPERLVIETGFDPDDAVYVDFEFYEEDPRALFDDLQPRIATQPASVNAVLPAAFVAQAFGDAPLSDADRRTLGLAFLTGAGAPQHIDAAVDLLRPLAERGDTRAASLMSEALETRAPAEAYRFALIAGAGGERGAAARLDRLEATGDMAEVLEIQANVASLVAQLGEARSLAEIRLAARERLTGQGRVRSYALASLWARLGAAAGDAESASVMADIADIMAESGAAEAWAPVDRATAVEAMKLWIDEDLAGALGPG